MPQPKRVIVVALVMALLCALALVFVKAWILDVTPEPAPSTCLPCPPCPALPPPIPRLDFLEHWSRVAGMRNSC